MPICPIKIVDRYIYRGIVGGGKDKKIDPHIFRMTLKIGFERLFRNSYSYQFQLMKFILPLASTSSLINTITFLRIEIHDIWTAHLN
jgi:hypothetical protein